MHSMGYKTRRIVIITEYILTLLVSLAALPSLARADVSLFLQEALGVSGEASGAGHASIYFSNICATNSVRLRLCEAGEPGVVISHYARFGADHPYEWVAVPLIPFLYAVEKERDIPLYVNGKVRTLMRETYRRTYWRNFIPDSPDGTLPAGHWQQMLGNSFNRDTYSFTLKTTAAEDAALIEKLNRLPNENHFNIIRHNCADFARVVLNTYFPHAAQRDVLNDFMIASPKAVAHSLTRYAVQRPARLFHITRYAQLAGPIRRSLDNRKYSEMALVSKKYLIPQILFQRELLVIFGASYFIAGRFSTQQAYRTYATPEIAQLNLAHNRLNERPSDEGDRTLILASLDHNFSGTILDAEETVALVSPSEIESRKEAERVRIFGTKQSWEKRRAEFKPLLQQAIADGLFADDKEVKTFFKDLELQSEPAFDEQGALILRVKVEGEVQTLGLTLDNILSPQSNPQLAYKLLLAKVNASLKGKDKNRETLETFEADWELMMQLSARSAPTIRPRLSRPPRFLATPEKTAFSQKLKKVFVLITH
jgi:hypothetical protein